MPVIGPTTDHKEIRFWAELNRAVPTEVLPQRLDHVPAELRLMLADQARAMPWVRVITWEEFFIKFDGLGLSFVYDDDAPGYNEILQIEEKSPYRHPSHRPQNLHH